MEAVLGDHDYGVSNIDFVLINRGDQDQVRRFRADVRLHGGIERTYRDGDNTELLPTSAIENSTHALSLAHPGAEPEELALALARHLLVAAEHVHGVDVRLAAAEYTSITVDGTPYPHNFTRSDRSWQTAAVQLVREQEPEVQGGVTDLDLFMTTGSTFTGFATDAYTTTPVFEDRAFGVDVTAVWTYHTAAADYAATRRAAWQALLSEFAAHTSRSSQHTFYSLARAVLHACPQVTSVVASGTHQKRNLVDLTGIGVSHDRQLYQVMDPLASVVSARADRAG